MDDLRKTPCEAVQNVSDKLLETKVSENVSLNTELAKVKVKLEESKDIISELEKKVYEAEAEVFQHHREAKQWKERVAKNEDEIKALKNSIKNHNAEILDAGTQITGLKKILKSKEKEIHSLENYKNNHQETIQILKSDIGDLKSENKKLLKERLVKTLKKFKSTSTNTLPPVPNVDDILSPSHDSSLNIETISMNSKTTSLNSQTMSLNSQTTSLNSFTNSSKTATCSPSNISSDTPSSLCINNNCFYPSMAETTTSLPPTTVSMCLNPSFSSYMASIVGTGMPTITLSKTTSTMPMTVSDTVPITSSTTIPLPPVVAKAVKVDIQNPTAKESNNAAMNTHDEVSDEYEEMVRRKALNLVKRKIEQKLKNVEIDDEALAQLEKELLEDLKETIQEALIEYRNKNTNDVDNL